MYRNYNLRHCNSESNANLNANDAYIENSCANVSNTLDIEYDECACGYDSYNMFPENPVLRTKLCTYSKNV